MAEEIGFENGRNSNFQGLVILTLTLDPAIRHTVVHHSSTSTYIPNFIEIEETFCGQTDGGTDGRTGGRTDGRTFSPSNIIRSTFGSRPNFKKIAADKNILQISSIEDVDCWSTGIRGLMRGMATFPQGNQELLVVRDKIGRSPGELG